ncbi:hypothetical protein FB451DRAFT_1411598 [Mycena latifolia]|nr:hypothetical protein FB451DRAFT_1411598 [Mycena latifolia]
MDPNHALHAVGVDQSYDNSVTSSDYSSDLVTASGYSPNLVTLSGQPNNAYAQNPASGYLHDSVAPQHPPVDVAALMTANVELAEQINPMRIGYNSEVQTEMKAYQASIRDDFDAVQAQRDAACAEVQKLSAEMAFTIKRLERLENASKAHPVHEHTRDPRVRPTPSKAHPANAQSTAKPTAAKVPPATPKPASDTRRSKTPKGSQPNPAPKPPRPSANLPHSFPNPSGLSAKGAHKSSASTSLPSALSSKGKNATKQGTPRKIAEHQMLKGDIDAEAQSFKSALQMHVRFLSGSLDSSSIPASATPAVVEQFELRFQGLTVTDLRRTGQIGSPIINPSKVKVGISVEDAVRSKNKIVRAFLQLEESAILHVQAYLAKLGITIWAVNFRQSPYSMYNMAMRMCAIDTFRYLMSGTYYDFLHPNTQYIKDSGLMTRLYDHFVHCYLFERYGRQVAAGSLLSETKPLRIVVLSQTCQKYLKDTKVPQRIQLLFAAKATSDDETTPQGPRAFAREERSESADQVIRAVDRLIVEDLHQDGKTRAANNRERRRVAPFGQCNPGYFQEVPKGLPIQYYNPAWFNNRPPQAWVKIAPKLIVVFPPGSQDFFSRRGDNLLSIAQLTKKFGPTVFTNYDLDFGIADAEALGEDVDADDEGEGDIVGSEDSDDEGETSDTGSVASFINNKDTSGGEQDDGKYDEQDGGMHSDDPASGDDLTSGKEQDGDQDGTWDGQAQFAAEYDIDMEEEIFGNGNDSIRPAIQYTVATGLATSALAVGCLIAYLARPPSPSYSSCVPSLDTEHMRPTDVSAQAMHFSLGRMYTNALLATLNSRRNLRKALEGSTLGPNSGPTVMTPLHAATRNSLNDEYTLTRPRKDASFLPS